MLDVFIQGMQDGKHNVVLMCDSSDIKGAFEEFNGPVLVNAEVNKIGRRISIRATAECDALLTCDYSLKEYAEKITAEIRLQYIIDTDLFLQQRDKAADDDAEIRAVHEDQKSIDISDDVRQELAVRLPLKRIAPEFRSLSAEDLLDKRYLDSAQTSLGSPADTWEALKNVKFDNN